MYESITKKLFSAESIAVFMHVNPDGDCVGSSLALYHYLRNLGKEVFVFTENKAEIRDNLYILPGIEVINAREQKYYDLGIAVDCGSSPRMGKECAKKFFSKCDDHACFDHHVTGEPFVDDLVFENVASTTQILYKFMVENDASAIDKNVAICLYAGLVTDSNLFSFSSTSAETLEIASKLLKYGIDGHLLGFKLLKEVSKETYALRARMLSSTQLYFDGRVGVIVCVRDDYIQTGTKIYDTEGVINDLLNVKGVKIAVSLAEMEDQAAFKVGIRTKDGVDAGKMASLFGGGGHFNASGCRLYGSLTDTMNKLLKAAKYVLDGEDA
ncbi:MAG: bifunctional oligoribonuclease/PAP phosphatase NrnA [Clostridia bacterium]|nr:bifunctional oligoribonuclease/PAP phosphatase NrnA [Clostridia bacterium]